MCSRGETLLILDGLDACPGSYDMEGHELERSLVAKFRQADKNGNGVIDRDELATLLSSFEDGAVEAQEAWYGSELYLSYVSERVNALIE